MEMYVQKLKSKMSLINCYNYGKISDCVCLHLHLYYFFLGLFKCTQRQMLDQAL